jgi:hypothetical protein
MAALVANDENNCNNDDDDNDDDDDDDDDNRHDLLRYFDGNLANNGNAEAEDSYNFFAKTSQLAF